MMDNTKLELISSEELKEYRQSEIDKIISSAPEEYQGPTEATAMEN